MVTPSSPNLSLGPPSRQFTPEAGIVRSNSGIVKEKKYDTCLSSSSVPERPGYHANERTGKAYRF